MRNPDSIERTGMLTGLSESLGCKIKPKKKITNNLIYSHCNLPDNMGNNDIHEIVVI